MSLVSQVIISDSDHSDDDDFEEELFVRKKSFVKTFSKDFKECNQTFLHYEEFKKTKYLIGSNTYLLKNHGDIRIREPENEKLYYSRYTFTCNSHVGCKAEAKCNWFEANSLWRISERGVHNLQIAAHKRSIHSSILPEVDNLLLQGKTPSQVLRVMKAKNTEVAISIPQVKNRGSIVRLQKKKSFGFLHNSEILEYGNNKLVTTKEEFDALGEDDLIVLQVFDKEVFDNSTKSNVRCYGFAYTSKNIIQNACRQNEDDKCNTPRCMDTSFNLDKEGWAHYSYGCNHLRRAADGKMRHQFRPFSFGINRTEVGSFYEMLIASTDNFVKTFYHLDIHATITCIDHNAGGAKAILDTAGEVTLCWPHIIRTAIPTTGRAKLVDKNFEETALQNIRDVHSSRSQPQMEALLELLFVQWESRNEAALADWFHKTYGSPPYMKWGINSAGIIGTVCSQQAIESYHHVEKLDHYDKGSNMGKSVTLGEFIKESIPIKLKRIGQDLCGPISSRRAMDDPYPREVIERAQILLETEDGMSTNWLSIPKKFELLKGKFVTYQGYVVNASTHFWQDEITNSLTNKRMKHFLSSLLGIFCANTTFDMACQIITSMHCVRIISEITAGNPRDQIKEYICDCAAFVHGTECSHCLAVMSLEGDFDLRDAASKIISGKQVGRPAKDIPVGYAAHKRKEMSSTEGELTSREATNLIGTKVCREFDGKPYCGNITKKLKQGPGIYNFTVYYPPQYSSDEPGSEDETCTFQEIRQGKQKLIQYDQSQMKLSKLLCTNCCDRGHLAHDCPSRESCDSMN